MDYCTTCRRHLNGALVCPGCGAYAPDIAPRGAAAAGTADWQAPAAGIWHDEPDPYAEDGTESPYEGPDAAPPAPLGRAARRRQRVRWKKSQRRAVVATAVALVGGGLTVAGMEGNSADRAQAAAAPDNAPMGAVGGQATEPTPAASAPTGRHRAPESTPAARPVTSNAPHEQTAGVPRATPADRAGTVAAPEPMATAAARAQSVATSATSTGAGAPAAPSEPAAAPTPTATATDSTPAPAASPEPDATSPAHLCLLVLCID